jgi:hypothetical protein
MGRFEPFAPELGVRKLTFSSGCRAAAVQRRRFRPGAGARDRRHSTRSKLSADLVPTGFQLMRQSIGLTALEDAKPKQLIQVLAPVFSN